MKTSLLLGLLLTVAVGAHAQTQKAAAAPAPATSQPAATATDEWGAPAAPATATPDAAPADNAAAPADNATGLDAALGAEPAKPGNVNTPVKPLGTTPKLNPNSTGSYDKKTVKHQNKRSDKAVMKRRRATTHYAEVRRNDHIRGVRRMEHGKISTLSSQR